MNNEKWCMDVKFYNGIDCNSICNKSYRYFKQSEAISMQLMYV